MPDRAVLLTASPSIAFSLIRGIDYLMCLLTSVYGIILRCIVVAVAVWLIIQLPPFHTRSVKSLGMMKGSDRVADSCMAMTSVGA